MTERGLIVVVALCALSCVRFSEDAPVAFADATVDDDTAVATACDRAGGFSAVENAMRALPEALASDCRVGARFAALTPDRRAHVAECMALQLGSILQCARDGVQMKYPAPDSNGVLCRDMRGAHKGQGIASGEFDVFVDHVLALLANTKLPATDQSAVREVLKFERGDIVERDAGVNDVCSTDAAADAGVSD